MIDIPSLPTIKYPSMTLSKPRTYTNSLTPMYRGVYNKSTGVRSPGFPSFFPGPPQYLKKKET